MGGWVVAQSPLLRTTITVSRLKKRGYVSLTELQSISFIIELPYTRPVRTVVWEAHSAHSWAEPSTRLPIVCSIL